MSDLTEHVSLSEWLYLQTRDEDVQIQAGRMIVEYRLQSLLRKRYRTLQDP